MATKVPAFTYSGTSSSEVKNGSWYIYLKSSGTIKFSYTKKLDACIVGGGGGGGSRGTGRRTRGGDGGTVVNRSGISASAGTGYDVKIGGGGGVGSAGGTSS